MNNYFRTIFFFFWVLKALNTNRMLENGHVFPHQVTIDFTTINADTFEMLSISTEPKNTKKTIPVLLGPQDVTLLQHYKVIICYQKTPNH